MSPESEWRGFTHQQLYDMVWSGPGAEVVVAAESAWAQFATTMSAVEERLNRAVRDVGAGWEGQAADAMTTAATPLGTWAFDTAEKGRQAAVALRMQSDVASHTRREMPQPVPPGSQPAETFPGNDPALRQAQDELRAQELMNTYAWNVSDAFGVMVDWPDPPVAVASTDTGVGPAGAGGRALSAGPGSFGDAGLGAGGVGGAGAAAPGAAGQAPGAWGGPGAAGPGAAGTNLGGPAATSALPGAITPGIGGPTTAGSSGRGHTSGRPGSSAYGGLPGSGATGTPPGAGSPGGVRPGTGYPGGTRPGTGYPGGTRPGAAAGATPRSPFDPTDPRTRFVPTSRPGSTPTPPPPAPTNWRDLVRANGGFAEPSGSGQGGRPPVVEQAPRGAGTPATPTTAAPAARPGTVGGHPGMMPMTGSGAGQGGETRRRAPYLLDDVGIFDVERDLPHHVPPILLPPDHPDYR